MEDERAILTAALTSAARIRRDMKPPPTLLSGPDQESIDQICEAIRRCVSFQAVAGSVLWSGGSGPVVDAPLLARPLYGKGVEFEEDIPGAVDWLLRLLTTKEAPGQFNAAIWGLSVDAELEISASSRLMPFDSLPASSLKKRILDRARRLYDSSVWISPSYFDVPNVAYVKKVPNFPYIGTDGACFRRIDELERETRDFWAFIEAVSVGRPIAIGCWFDYEDEELDLNSWQNNISWILPEIHPWVGPSTPTQSATIQDELRRYSALTLEFHSDLLRSMKRFTLSRCRHQIIDRILDLTLAFEIAVSGGGDNAPLSWKVSVRSTQLIGGPLDARQIRRKKIGDLYRLRSRATHGGSLADGDHAEHEALAQECSEIYRELIKSILLIGTKPDWSALEIEPRTR